jgi:hypothetical protein
MRAKTYSLTLVASALTLFAAVASLNLVLDPQAAFGTRLVPSSFRNDRFVQFAAWQAAADTYDGVLFASSRGRFIPPDELGQRMHANFAAFTLEGGTLSDHVPLLAYIVRQQAARGKPLKAVMLLLDIEEIGNPPAALVFDNTVMPPEVTGESKLRFWWRHLTWVQLRAWRGAIREAWRLAGAIVGTALAQEREQSQERMNPQVPFAVSYLHKPIRQRDGFDRDLDLLRRFVALCREHRISLMVALSPANPRNPILRDPDLAQAIERIAAVVPLWDFTRQTHLLPDLTRYWMADGSHFTAEVGRLMLRRMFGEELPGPWEDFGERRG